MATIVYLLCAVTSALCAFLLMREYRRTGTRLLLWSSLAFFGFVLTNSLMYTDYVLAPQMDLSLLRAVLAFLSISVLAFGLVWDAD